MDNEQKNEDFRTDEVQEPRGPQFDDSAPEESIYERIAKAKNNGWGKQVNDFVSQHRATLIPLASLVLAVALGLGAIALLNDKEVGIDLTDNGALQEEVQEPAAPQQSPEEPSEPSEGAQEQEPQTEQVEGAVIATAQAGDGITHLARRVIAERLQESGRSLNAEQLIYAEDYLQNATGSYPLEVGQDVSFSADDIESAIDSALELQQWQLDSLQRFTE